MRSGLSGGALLGSAPKMWAPGLWAPGRLGVDDVGGVVGSEVVGEEVVGLAVGLAVGWRWGWRWGWPWDSSRPLRAKHQPATGAWIGGETSTRDIVGTRARAATPPPRIKPQPTLPGGTLTCVGGISGGWVGSGRVRSVVVVLGS